MRNSLRESKSNSALQLESQMSFIVLIEGGSSSGKSIISETLCQMLRKEFSVLIINQDNYYKDISSLSKKKISHYNFDSPDAIDTKAFVHDVVKLSNGESIEERKYNFVTHRNLYTGKFLEPVDILLCEGLFVFDSEIQSDLKVFIEVDDDIRFIRRLQRDEKERKITPNKTITQYLNTVKPMYEKFIKPAMQKADMVLINNQCITNMTSSDNIDKQDTFSTLTMQIMTEIKRRIQ